MAALAAALLWAVGTVAYRQVGEQVPPRELNLVKGVVAVAMLGLTLLLTGDALQAVEPLALVLLFFSGAIGIGLGDTVYFESLQDLGARRALLLGILAPPMAGLIAWLALDEALTPGAWLGVGVTVLGVAWVVTERLPNSPAGAADYQPPRLWRGIGFGLLAVLAQAAGVVLSRAAFIHTSVSPLWAATLRLAAGVLMLLVWIPLARQPVGRWLKGERRKRLWGQLLFAITAGTFLAVWLQQVAVKLTSAGIAQTLLSTSPLFVLPFAAWMGERVTARAVLGAVLALAGIGLLFGLSG